MIVDESENDKRHQPYGRNGRR